MPTHDHFLAGDFAT